MLNPFPIQFLSMVAYLVLRVVVGIILVRLGTQTVQEAHRSNVFKSSTERTLLWSIGITEVVAGLLFIAGFYTQIAALITLGVVGARIILRAQVPHLPFPDSFFITLLGAVSLALFITGGGTLAIDLPI